MLTTLNALSFASSRSGVETSLCDTTDLVDFAERLVIQQHIQMSVLELFDLEPIPPEDDRRFMEVFASYFLCHFCFLLFVI